jgi:hypothetical protein
VALFAGTSLWDADLLSAWKLVGLDLNPFYDLPALEALLIAASLRIVACTQPPPLLTKRWEPKFSYGFPRLTTVEFAAGANLLNLGDSSFSRCISLEKTTIPASVLVIGNDCFGLCSSLPQVDF